MDVYQKLTAAYNAVKNKIPYKPGVALVLGSGLGGFADGLEIDAAINYGDIAGFPKSTVEGHKGRFIFARVGGVPTVIMQGRVHLYEGYDISDVVLPVRLMRLMGANTLFLTNAAGGLGDGFYAGGLMLITDHISTFVRSPLIGKNFDELGVRFPDMTSVYDKKLCQIIKNTAKNNNIELFEGVYCQIAGPNFETPAEIRMLKTLGADATGMSTAVEALAAHHTGMRVCGVSLISNLAAGISSAPLSAEEVNETAALAAPSFKKLVYNSISEMKAL